MDKKEKEKLSKEWEIHRILTTAFLSVISMSKTVTQPDEAIMKVICLIDATRDKIEAVYADKVIE